jgi:hypothetical protein
VLFLSGRGVERVDEDVGVDVRRVAHAQLLW